MQLPEVKVTQTKVGSILRDGADLYDRKNADYGDSWRKQGRILAAMFPNGITLKTEEDFTKFFVVTRMIDKLNRATNIEFITKGQQVKDETVKDTYQDLAVYAAMIGSLR